MSAAEALGTYAMMVMLRRSFAVAFSNFASGEATRQPLLCLSDHPSPWDGVLALAHARRLNLPFRMLVSDDLIARHRFFQQVGYVPVVRGDWEASQNFLLEQVRWMHDCGGMLWCAAPGEMVRSVDIGRLPRGVGSLVGWSTEARTLLVNFRYELFGFTRPIAWMSFRPLEVECQAPAPEAWASQIRERLVDCPEVWADTGVPDGTLWRLIGCKVIVFGTRPIRARDVAYAVRVPVASIGESEFVFSSEAVRRLRKRYGRRVAAEAASGNFRVV